MLRKKSLPVIHHSKGERGKAIDYFEAALEIASLFNRNDRLFRTRYSFSLEEDPKMHAFTSYKPSCAQPTGTSIGLRDLASG